MSEQIRPHGIDDLTRVASVSDVEKINAQIERVQAKGDARLAQLLEIERTARDFFQACDVVADSIGGVFGDDDETDSEFSKAESHRQEMFDALRKAVMG